MEVRHRGPVISPGRVQQPCKDVLLAVGWWWWWQVVLERRWYLVAPGSGPVAPSQDPGQSALSSVVKRELVGRSAGCRHQTPGPAPPVSWM